jgi:ribosomal protein S27AE
MKILWSMRKNILDEADQLTGPRTCPECGHRFPLGVFMVRFVMSFGLSRWACQGCGTLLKCDFVKIQSIWFVGMLLIWGLGGLLVYYYDPNFFLPIFLLVNFAFIFITLYFVKFEKYG